MTNPLVHHGHTPPPPLPPKKKDEKQPSIVEKVGNPLVKHGRGVYNEETGQFEPWEKVLVRYAAELEHQSKEETRLMSSKLNSALMRALRIGIFTGLSAAVVYLSGNVNDFLPLGFATLGAAILGAVDKFIRDSLADAQRDSEQPPQ